MFGFWKKKDKVEPLKQDYCYSSDKTIEDVSEKKEEFSLTNCRNLYDVRTYVTKNGDFHNTFVAFKVDARYRDGLKRWLDAVDYSVIDTLRITSSMSDGSKFFFDVVRPCMVTECEEQIDGQDMIEVHCHYMRVSKVIY